MKEQSPLGRRASIGTASSAAVTNRLRTPEHRSTTYAGQTAHLTNTPKSTVQDVLRSSGKVAKLPRVVPHALTPQDQRKRVDTCTSLLNRRRTFACIDSIVTNDEKYCVYDTLVRRKHWVDFDELPQPQPKPDHDKKELLFFWWDINGPVLWELVPTGSMVDSNVFCAQLEKMSEILHNRNPRRGKILLFTDNARPHTAKDAQKKLEELGIELVPHPPYLSDLPPSDYHVFRSLQSFSAGKKFAAREEVKRGVNNFLPSNSPEFSARGVRPLPET
ncbi:unnamed protein product [Heligmosomoides polygyrus]|uniref:Transposase n=1 Tax=Heligmosomoides polygyrus TaxID=6339 RepID=A0A183G3Z3_HELPZ|nr:unnamed protein product [Heligmosomoides polygyrus]